MIKTQAENCSGQDGIRTIGPQGKLPHDEILVLDQGQGQLQGWGATRQLSPRRIAPGQGLRQNQFWRWVGQFSSGAIIPGNFPRFSNTVFPQNLISQQLKLNVRNRNIIQRRIQNPIKDLIPKSVQRRVTVKLRSSITFYLQKL